MKNLFTKEVLGSKLVLSSLGIVVVVILGAGIYYWQGSRVPAPSMQGISTATSTAQGTGTVEPAQNGTLAFEVGGRVVRVPQVGQTVAAGETIASLDTATLSAQLQMAQANLAQAQAKLDALNAGPRPVDLAPKQTAVSSAQQTVADDYVSAESVLAGSYSTVYQAVHADTDSLITNPDSTSATLSFETKNNQDGTDALAARTTTDSELTLWQNELTALGTAPAPAAVDAAATAALAHLAAVRDFGDALTAALSGAIPTNTFPQSSITAANTAVGAMNTTVESQIAALLGDAQKLSADTLALQSAQDALAQAQAPSTPQDIEAAQAAVEGAQASVASDDAQIGNAILVAPFSGTVSSVQVKAGDIATMGTPAVVVTPNAALQVVAYFSEVDAAKLTSGEPADVTLDAYGQNRHFPATIVSVDRSPTMLNGSAGQANIPAFEVVVQFAQNDPAISVGMSANVTVNTQ